MISIRPYAKNPKFWEYDLEFDFPSGAHYRERRKSPARTETQTRAYAEARLATLLKAGFSTPNAKPKASPNLSEFWPRYLENMRAERAKPATLQTQASIYRSRLAASLGAKRLDEIGPLDFAQLKAQLQDKAPGTVNVTLSQLSGILKVAHEQGERATPPPKVKYLRTIAPEAIPYTSDEAARLLARARDPFDRAFLLLGLDAGLRAGEMAALRRGDVDLVGRKLQIRKNLSGGEESTPKSKKGERLIHLTQRLADALAAQLKTHAAPRVLFIPESTAKQTNRASLARMLGQLERKAGIVTAPSSYIGKMHKLRHTFASRLASAGATAKEIAELLGHSTLRQAEHYIHLAPEQRPRAIALLEAL